MSEATFSVKNFDKYQHYRDRNPPWIKFHHATLGDYEFNRLPDAVKWHLVGIWSLASQHNNRLPFDSAWIQQRIGAVERVDLNALAEAGWLLVQHASKTGARRQRKATSETEAQEQAEEEKIPPAPTEPAPRGDRDKARALGEAVAAERRAKDAALKADFEAWWAQYPRRKAKGAALKAYRAARAKGVSITVLVAGAMRYAAERQGQEEKFTAHAASWLNAERWLDEPEKPHVASLGRKAAVLDPDEQVRRRRAQIAGGVAAIRQRGRHDPGREGEAFAGGEARAGQPEPADHGGADGGGNGPHGGVGGDVQPAAEGLGQGGGFLLGGFEASAGGLAGNRDGAGEVQSPAGDAPATAPGDRYPGAGRTLAANGAQDQAVPGPALPGSRPGGDALPGHDPGAEGGVRSDAGGLEQQIQVANLELTDDPLFLRRTA